MADPGSLAVMAAVGAIGSLAGGFVSAAGAQYEGQARANMLNYQAGIAQINQQIAEQNARYALEEGEVEAQRVGMKTRAEIGAQKVAFAAGNLDVNVGSARMVMESTRELGVQDEAMTRYNASKKAYAARIEAFAKGSEAQLDIMGAQVAKTAGDIGATSSILGGVTSFASKWATAGQYFGKTSPSGGLSVSG